jgi:hypothetical protein
MDNSIQNYHDNDRPLISTPDRPLDPGIGAGSVENPHLAATGTQEIDDQTAAPVVTDNTADVASVSTSGETNQTGLPVQSPIQPEMDQLGSAEAPMPAAGDNKDAQPLVTRLVSRETLNWVKPSGASAYAPQSDPAAESAPHTVTDGGDPAALQSDSGTSDLLQLDAKTYPWLYANSTLEACFVNSEDGSQGVSFFDILD